MRAPTGQRTVDVSMNSSDNSRMRTLSFALGLLCPMTASDPVLFHVDSKPTPLDTHVTPLTHKPSKSSRPVFQKGIASWYGNENRTGPTGKALRRGSPALAHKTLPIGTWVKVTSLKTNRTVIAIVEDRGPYVKGRIADLNYPAAKQLGIINHGIDRVRLEIVR